MFTSPRDASVVADDAATPFLDWRSNGQQIAVTSVQDEGETLVRDAKEAGGAGDAAAGIFERFADQAAFVTEHFGVERESLWQ